MLSKSSVIYLCNKFMNYRHFSVTQSCHYIQKYRKQRKLPLNPNACGVLTDTPDYSYLDGRLTPLTEGQRQRNIRQQEIKNQIMELTGEIDFAADRHKRLLAEEEDRKRNIIENKLKPKGKSLLKSK